MVHTILNWKLKKELLKTQAETSNPKAIYQKPISEIVESERLTEFHRSDLFEELLAEYQNVVRENEYLRKRSKILQKENILLEEQVKIVTEERNIFASKLEAQCEPPQDPNLAALQMQENTRRILSIAKVKCLELENQVQTMGKDRELMAKKLHNATAMVAFLLEKIRTGKLADAAAEELSSSGEKLNDSVRENPTSISTRFNHTSARKRSMDLITGNITNSFDRFANFLSLKEREKVGVSLGHVSEPGATARLDKLHGDKPLASLQGKKPFQLKHKGEHSCDAHNDLGPNRKVNFDKIDGSRWFASLQENKALSNHGFKSALGLKRSVSMPNKFVNNFRYPSAG